MNVRSYDVSTDSPRREAKVATGYQLMAHLQIIEPVSHVDRKRWLPLALELNPGLPVFHVDRER